MTDYHYLSEVKNRKFIDVNKVFLYDLFHNIELI